jgi:GTP pyrophosphokinase
LGKVSARQVISRLDPDLVAEERPSSDEKTLSSMVKKVFRRHDAPIQVTGYDDLLVYRAKCCNPIRGEEIIGYITVGRGISVHSVDCPNLEHLLLNPERKVDVSWTSDGDTTRYPVRLTIRTEDRTGLLADITAAVSNIKTNILDARARLLDGQLGLIEITVEVSDSKHLEKITNYIKKIGGVREVERSQKTGLELR